jgi:hypothetical protein
MAPKKSTLLNNLPSINTTPDSSENEFVLQPFSSQKQPLDGVADGGYGEENDDMSDEELKKSLR